MGVTFNGDLLMADLEWISPQQATIQRNTGTCHFCGRSFMKNKQLMNHVCPMRPSGKWFVHPSQYHHILLHSIKFYLTLTYKHTKPMRFEHQRFTPYLYICSFIGPLKVTVFFIFGRHFTHKKCYLPILVSQWVCLKGEGVVLNSWVTRSQSCNL